MIVDGADDIARLGCGVWRATVFSRRAYRRTRSVVSPREVAGGCAIFHEVAEGTERLEPRNLDRQMEQMPQVGGEVCGRYSEAFGGWQRATRPVAVDPVDEDSRCVSVGSRYGVVVDECDELSCHQEHGDLSVFVIRS